MFSEREKIGEREEGRRMRRGGGGGGFKYIF